MITKSMIMKNKPILVGLGSLVLGLVLGLALTRLWTTQGWQTGFAAKTVWDWLELLIIPAGLALIVYLFNQSENSREREIAQDDRHEDILQHYFDKMTDLMMNENWLVKSGLSDKKNVEANGFKINAMSEGLFDIARVRTVSALRALEIDKKRQTSIMHFLKEIDLYNPDLKPALLIDAIMSDIDLSELSLYQIIMMEVNLTNSNLEKTNLSGANLEYVNLTDANLRNSNLTSTNLRKSSLHQANLQYANLSHVNLQEAFLIEANLQDTTLIKANLKQAILVKSRLQRALLAEANLEKADLTGVNLQDASLGWANLQGAQLAGANLNGVNLGVANLQGAKNIKLAKFNPESVLPDSTKWTTETVMARFTDPSHSDFWQPSSEKDEIIYSYWQEQGWLQD